MSGTVGWPILRDVRLAVGRNAWMAWVGALLIASGACTPLDDLAVYVFGRSMRDSRSFDPYENTIAPPENSVPFASGNNTPGPGRLNTGQPEPGLMPAPFAQTDLLEPVVQNLPNPVPADQASLDRRNRVTDSHDQDSRGLPAPGIDVGLHGHARSPGG